LQTARKDAPQIQPLKLLAALPKDLARSRGGGWQILQRDHLARKICCDKFLRLACPFLFSVVCPMPKQGVVNVVFPILKRLRAQCINTN
jgi:hypothetical protein